MHAIIQPTIIDDTDSEEMDEKQNNIEQNKNKNRPEVKIPKLHFNSKGIRKS